jgi:hypothetical protein
MTRNATFEEMIELCDGLVRIAIDDSTATLTWEDVKRTSGMDKAMARGLYKAAIAVGAKPSQWFACFDPVRIDKWIDVESWSEDRWSAVDGWRST